ncbi:MAG: transposase [bacterium]
MSRNSFITGDHYHIYNHGIDGRNLFLDKYDFERFRKSLTAFNSIKPIGSIFENQHKKKVLGGTEVKVLPREERLVDLVAYCINPNHFHLVLRQNIDGGISRFMKSVSGGYTKYINNKLKRRGSIFENVFRSKHAEDEDYLLHLSAYVNLNDRVHGLVFEETGRSTSLSSWAEYTEDIPSEICEKNIILSQFENNKEKYNLFGEYLLPDMTSRKEDDGQESY